MDRYHIPVLLSEVTEFLKVEKGKKYIDATLGGGGHSGRIIDQGGIVLGLDVDQDALGYVQNRIKNQESRIRNNLKLARGNFRNIDEIAKDNGFETVAGVLFDLGVSSHQIDTGLRGFSFQQNAPLDMRMDQSSEVRAKDLVNGLTKGELVELFQKLGEEQKALKIADRIVEGRQQKLIETTFELAELVETAYGVKNSNPKLRAQLNKNVFQALRIAVNDELHAIAEALPKGLDLLESGGRFVVITFHSLEDRIVKRTFQDFEQRNLGRIITKKPIIPLQAEQQSNRRSRSAKLRVFEKK